jgi:fumarylpyruvate hydrolase
VQDRRIFHHETSFVTMNFVITPPLIPSVPVSHSLDVFPVRRIYCVGLNYAEHAMEMGHTGRELPVFFMKPADAVLPVTEGAVGRMNYPSLTANLHHEVELVVAIGKGGRHISQAEALDHVWGYAVGLDMTRRDLQTEMKKLGRPWCIGKGFDQGAPIGPIVAKAQSSCGPESEIVLEVNGKVRQRSKIGAMIWNVPEIIAHLSKAWELSPGDLIFTGTPEGVGPVVPGDRISARIDGVGSVMVDVVDAKA